MRGCLVAAVLVTLLVVLVLAGGRVLDLLRIASLKSAVEAELAAFYAESPERPEGTGAGLAIDHHLAALEQLTRLTTLASGAGIPYGEWAAWIDGREGPAFERVAAGARCRAIGLLPYARRGVVDCPIEQQGLTVAGELVELSAKRATDPADAVQRSLDLLRLTGDLGRSAHASLQHDLLTARERVLRALESLASRERLPAGVVDRILACLREDLEARRDPWTLVRGQYLAQQVAFVHYLEQGTHGAPGWAKVPGKAPLGGTGDADADEVVAAWRAWRACGAELRAALADGDLGPVDGARARFRAGTVLERLAAPGGLLESERRLRAREEALVRRLAHD